MLVGCNTFSFVGDTKTDIDAIRFLASAGFKCIDLNLNRYGVRDTIDAFWKQPKARLWEYARSIGSAAKECGVKISQVHSPYPTYFPSKRKVQEVFEIGDDCIYMAAFMEAPYVVIHPNVPPQCVTKDQVDEAVEKNIDYYGGFAPSLRKTGVRMGLENMFNWDFENDRPLPTVASTADCMCYMLDTLNHAHADSLYVACLDTGHAMLSGGGDIPKMIRTLAHRLKLMHTMD